MTARQPAARGAALLCAALLLATVCFTPGASAAEPPPDPAVSNIVGYTPYRVKLGDTLRSIAARGGSDADLLRRYNRLEVEPQPGRELIVPQLRGRASALPNPRQIMVLKGNTAKPWVALTLDCGGQNPRTHDILATLRAANVRITFFLLGGSIVHDPALLRQMVADGHELASHSYTHADFSTLSDAQITAELWRTEQAVRRIAGPNVSVRPFFRFPYGAYNVRALEAVVANGYIPVHWNLDSLDSWGEPKTPEFIASRLTTKIPRHELPGSILLSHCSDVTADALPAILKGFAEQGIEVRTLSDVLGP